MKALLPKISESEIVVVQHPGIYHAVCFYLPNRDRIKLYLPAGLPRHFFGRPLIRKAELISGMELDQLQLFRMNSLAQRAADEINATEGSIPHEIIEAIAADYLAES